MNDSAVSAEAYKIKLSLITTAQGLLTFYLHPIDACDCFEAFALALNSRQPLLRKFLSPISSLSCSSPQSQNACTQRPRVQNSAALNRRQTNLSLSLSLGQRGLPRLLRFRLLLKFLTTDLATGCKLITQASYYQRKKPGYNYNETLKIYLLLSYSDLRIGLHPQMNRHDSDF